MSKNLVLILQLLCCLSLSWGYDKVSSFIEEGIRTDNAVNIKPFTQIGDGYYYFEENVRRNWYEAYEQCRKIGAELITLETEEEYNIIDAYLKQRKDMRPYWISANDLANEGKHVWFSNGQVVSIKKWAPNQPDNLNGVEHCDRLNYKDKNSGVVGINDEPCSGMNPYICEAPHPKTASFIVW